jgi:hypothetical protein
VVLSDMPRHVALIGEARLESDLRKGQRASAQKRHRSLDAGEHDVAMRRMSRRAGEGPAEMERLRPAMSAIASMLTSPSRLSLI